MAEKKKKGTTTGTTTIEDKVVKTVDFEKVGKRVSDERIGKLITDTQKSFGSVYEGQKGLVYELDEEAMKEAPEGTTIHKVTPIDDQITVENIADALGIYLAKKHHRKLALDIEEAKKKLEKGDFDEEKQETEESVREELNNARGQLQKLGFNWEDICKYLGEHGLDEALKNEIKESYGKQAPSYEASKHLIPITDAHKPLLVDHLIEKNRSLVRYKLESKPTEELKGVLVQTHTLHDRYKDPEKADVLAREQYDNLRPFYRSNAARPKLKKEKSA